MDLPERPFFIVGYMRSGTTLLAALLDRHPEMCVTPETAFYNEAMKRIDLRAEHTHDRLLRGVVADRRFDDLHIDLAELERRFRAGPPEPRRLLGIAMDLYRAGRGVRRVGEKTPAHIRFVPHVMESFPGARVINIVRDGRDCVNSVLRAPWGMTNPVAIAMAWASAVRLGDRYVREFGSQRFLSIRYEDLLHSPVPVLRQVMGFLEERFEPCQLDTSVKTGVCPDWEVQWKGKVDGDIDPSRCYAWRRDADPSTARLVTAVVRPTLRHAGYPDTDLSDCPPLERVRLLALGATYRRFLKPHRMRSLRKLAGRVANAARSIRPAASHRANVIGSASTPAH